MVPDQYEKDILVPGLIGAGTIGFRFNRSRIHWFQINRSRIRWFQINRSRINWFQINRRRIYWFQVQ